MTPDQIAALEAAAKKATPGPWHHGSFPSTRPNGRRFALNEVATFGGSSIVHWIGFDEAMHGGDAASLNAAFIALANPSAILSIIATIRDLERERAEAFKAGMMRAAEIALSMTSPQACAEACWSDEAIALGEAISTAIRAEAKGSGG